MASVKRVRTKACDRCGTTASPLFRIQHNAAGDWIFTCKPCQMEASTDNPHYPYGGTWKSTKRH